MGRADISGCSQIPPRAGEKAGASLGWYHQTPRSPVPGLEVATRDWAPGQQTWAY